jgi:hypothetical protein
MPRYSIQGNLVDTCPILSPSMYITCRACNTAYWITGTEIPTEAYSINVAYDDIESSIDQTLDKMGWNDCICNYCQDIDPNIVKTYNDTIDRHDED